MIELPWMVVGVKEAALVETVLYSESGRGSLGGEGSEDSGSYSNVEYAFSDVDF